MTWKPISEADLWDELNGAWPRMSVGQQRLWEAIRIEPEKWSLPPWGDLGGGFWAVGVVGRQVLWYNDIEDGFNISNWRRYGQIEGYWCDQDELEWAIQKLLNEVETGQRHPFKMGPPQPVKR